MSLVGHMVLVDQNLLSPLLHHRERARGTSLAVRVTPSGPITFSVLWTDFPSPSFSLSPITHDCLPELVLATVVEGVAVLFLHRRIPRFPWVYYLFLLYQNRISIVQIIFLIFR